MFGFLGSAIIDLDPSALEPNSILPEKNPTIFSLEISNAIFLNKS